MLGLLFATTLAAQDLDDLTGVWGTRAQCAGATLVPGGSKQAEPYDIRHGWLRQGDLWCQLKWFRIQSRGQGIFATARALCGEDAVRGYRLDLALDGDQLHLIWDETLVNGPLHRCSPR